jgi:hypothetical protein
MAHWFKRLLGGAALTPSPRDVLDEAVSALADASLIDKALALFDAPDDFVEYALKSGNEPAWLEEERQPTPEELASNVLLRVLLVEGYVGHIDWAAGASSVFDTFDSLLVKRRVSTLSAVERATLTECVAGAARGDAFMRLLDPLAASVKKRGLEVVYLDLGQDAHFPLLLSIEAHLRWRDASFGMGTPVLPL